MATKKQKAAGNRLKRIVKKAKSIRKKGEKWHTALKRAAKKV